MFFLVKHVQHCLVMVVPSQSGTLVPPEQSHSLHVHNCRTFPTQLPTHYMYMHTTAEHAPLTTCTQLPTHYMYTTAEHAPLTTCTQLQNMPHSLHVHNCRTCPTHCMYTTAEHAPLTACTQLQNMLHSLHVHNSPLITCTQLQNMLHSLHVHNCRTCPTHYMYTTAEHAPLTTCTQHQFTVPPEQSNTQSERNVCPGNGLRQNL